MFVLMHPLAVVGDAGDDLVVLARWPIQNRKLFMHRPIHGYYSAITTTR